MRSPIPSSTFVDRESLLQKLALPLRADGLVVRLLFRALGIDALANACETAGLDRNSGDLRSALGRLLEHLDITADIRYPPEGIPWSTSGPVILVANHPYGIADAFTVLREVLTTRQDCHMFSNRIMASFALPDSHAVWVRPRSRQSPPTSNYRALRATVHHLQQGRSLVVFPAGRCSHLRWDGRFTVTDPSWSNHVAVLARMTGADIVPIHVDGMNSPLFQALGFLDIELRKMLLFREFLALRGRKIRVTVGSRASIASFLSEGATHDSITQAIRQSVYGLKGNCHAG